MAIVWAEGFDHYGTGATGDEGRTFMLQGAWAQFSSGNGPGAKIYNSNARTGTCCLRFPYNDLATDSPKARRVLGAAHIVVGCALGIYFGSLPNSNGAWGFEFRNNANNCIAYIAVQSDGAIGLYTGSGRTLIASSDPVITALSWQHIEAKLVIDNVVGSAEVRVNGLSVLNMTNINLGTLGSTQMTFGMPAGKGAESSKNVDFDDIVVWNDSGDDNNDFIGQQRVELVWAVSDTAQADWALFGDTDGFDCIDNNPQDGDTTYLSGETGDVSEFGVGDLPPETEEIRGIYIPTMSKLVAAGVGNIQTSLVSGADVSLGPDQTVTTAYTYWGSVHEKDPATDARWTKSGFEASLLRIEKTL